MKIKIDKADQAFSKAIRLRDKFSCTRCGHYYPEGIGLQVSHYFGRRYESVRFDPNNADTICMGCHMQWHSNPEEYRQWKLNQLGEKGFDILTIAAHTYKKKDRAMRFIEAKEYLKLMEKEYEEYIKNNS